MKTRYTITLFVLLVCGVSCKKGSMGALTFSPAVDTAGGIVTISGINFGATPESDLVFFMGANPAQIISASSTQLTVVVPQYASDGKINVVINESLYTSSAQFFVSPTCIPNAQGVGYAVTLSAPGFFSTVLSANVVKFNGTIATVTAANSDQLTVTVPTGATSGPVSVTVNGRTLSTLANFTVLPNAQVSTLATGFNQPEGLATDGSGNIYVADYGDNQIRLVTPAGVVSTFAGSGAIYTMATDGPKYTANLNGPSSLVLVGDSNTIYETDLGGNRVREIKNGYISTLSNISGIPYTIYFFPTGISIDGGGNLFFVNEDFSNIEEITADSIAQVYSGTDITLTEGGMQVGATLYDPAATAFDQAGNLYLADMGNDRILKFSTSGQITIFAGGGASVAGDGPGTQAGFQHPAAIAFDGQGNLYVADEGNNEIRRIDPFGNTTTVAGSAVSAPGSVDGVGVGATFNQPDGIVVDKNGVIYVSEAGGNRVRKIILQ
jgi:sugar lactone lactonase YvrE